MKKLFSVLLAAFFAVTASAKTTYIIWQHQPVTGSEQWVNSNYNIWENTYTQTNVDDALQLSSGGKGWVGGGYESRAPFDNRVLTEGYDLVFDIKTTDPGELSVMLTSAAPEVSQSVKLKFERNGEWQTVRLSVKDKFPKVFKAWTQGGNGYVFSLVGGAADDAKIYLRDIRYQPSK